MRRSTLIAIAAAAALLLTACGSSKPKTGGSEKSGATAGAAIKVGVLTSLTGPFASGFTTTEKAVKARFALENDAGGVNGTKITYIMADDAGTPAGAQAAVTKLIQQDKVFAILSISPTFVGAAKLATAAGVPVIGAGWDGGQGWLDPSAYPNMFEDQGMGKFGLESTTLGEFFKSVGATKIAGVANTGAPSSALGAQESVASSLHAGLTKGYLNYNLAPGTTDVGPVVLGIKNSRSDAVYLPTVPNTAFALIAGLKQANANMKAVLLSTGYGGDLLGNPAALQSAEGTYFASAFAPVELQTDGTKKFQAALSKYAGEAADVVPTFAEYNSWVAADLFVAGMKNAGVNPTQATFIQKTRTMSYDMAGLSKSSYRLDEPGKITGGATGPGNCVFIVRLTNKQFVPIPDASPKCGELIS